MNNGNLFDYVHTILRKEKRGNIIKPDRFSHLLKVCHHEYYNQQVEKFDLSQTVHDSLRPFLVINDSATFSTGVEAIADLTSTYRNMVAAYAGTTNARFDIVTPQEWVWRLDDELTQPTAAKPIMMVDGTNINILPTSITAGYVTYLKEADNEPFFDYYIDANRDIQWMGINAAEYTLQTSEVYRDGTTSGKVVSINRELEWNDFDKMRILDLILQKLGVSLSEAEIVQYANIQQQKANTV